MTQQRKSFAIIDGATQITQYKKALSRILERQQEEVNSCKEGTAYDKALDLLAAQIESKILDQAATGVVLKMTEVCSFYNSEIP